MFVPPNAESDPERDALLNAREQAEALLKQGVPLDEITQRLVTAHQVDEITAESIVAPFRRQRERDQADAEEDSSPAMKAGRIGAIIGAVLGAAVQGAMIPDGETYPYPFAMMRAAVVGAAIGGFIGYTLANIANQYD